VKSNVKLLRGVKREGEREREATARGLADNLKASPIAAFEILTCDGLMLSTVANAVVTPMEIPVTLTLLRSKLW